MRKPLIIRDATYQDVVDAPDLMIAELIDGDLYAWPRPDGPHIETSSVFGIVRAEPFPEAEIDLASIWGRDEV